MMRYILLAAALLTLTTPALAVRHDTCSWADTTAHHFRPLHLVLPVSLSLGGALLGARYGDVNRDVRLKVVAGEGRGTHIDEVLPFVPAAAVYGLNLCGVRGQHNLRNATGLLALAFCYTEGCVQVSKHVLDVGRPDRTDQSSFPSGHTALAFMTAEFLRTEYSDTSPWIGVGGYAVALTTGYLRMYNNRHWLSDVVTGAGVGLMGMRLAYWTYPWLQRLYFHWFGRPRGSEALTSALIVPYYEPSRQTAGFGLALTF